MSSGHTLRGLRVLHIANTGFFLEKLLLGKLQGLSREGVEIFAASPPPAADIGFPVFALPLAREISPIEDARAVAACVRLLRREHFDLVHTHSSKAGFVGRLSSKLCGVPCVHTVHGLPFYPGQARAQFYLCRMLERLASSWSAAILTQNAADAQTLRDLRFFDANRILFEGNGVDVASLRAMACERDAVRRELGIAEDRFVVGYFARVEPVKGHLVFLKAFEQLYARCPQAVALLAGVNFGRDTDYAIQVADAICNSPAREGVRVLGFRSDAQRLLCGCDAVCLASEKEGIPRILMESGALGLPCAATNAPGTRELVVHGETGLLSPVADADALAQSLLLLAQSPALRRQLGNTAQQRICEQFDERDVIARILDAYALICRVH